MKPKEREQFFSIAKGVFKILCPGVEYKQGKGFNNQIILSLEDQTEQIFYLFKFNHEKNDIFFKMEVDVDGEKKKKEITWKLGSVSIADMVDQIRKEKNTIQTRQGNPFSVLNKLKQ